jgi:hypothetical protein
LVGLPLESATQQLNVAGLTAVSRPGSPGTPPNVVQKQEPSAETFVREKSSVTLTYSIQTPTVAVPDLTGLTFDEGRQSLANLGLVATKSDEATAEVPEGTVLRTIPKAGKEVERGTKVGVVVSKALARADLKLVKVKVSKTGPQKGLVDIWVRNDGDQVAIITDVAFSILSDSESTASGGGLSSTATYDVAFPGIGGPPFPLEVVKDVSEQVGPVGAKAASRFRLVVAPEGPSTEGHFYRFKVAVTEANGQEQWAQVFDLKLVGSQASKTPPTRPTESTHPTGEPTAQPVGSQAPITPPSLPGLSAHPTGQASTAR